jgi:hypothetical protein
VQNIILCTTSFITDNKTSKRVKGDMLYVHVVWMYGLYCFYYHTITNILLPVLLPVLLLVPIHHVANSLRKHFPTSDGYQLNDHFNDNQPDDNPLQLRSVCILHLLLQNIQQLLQHIQSLIQNLHSAVHL